MSPCNDTKKNLSCPIIHGQTKRCKEKGTTGLIEENVIDDIVSLFMKMTDELFFTFYYFVNMLSVNNIYIHNINKFNKVGSVLFRIIPSQFNYHYDHLTNYSDFSTDASIQ